MFECAIMVFFGPKQIEEFAPIKTQFPRFVIENSIGNWAIVESSSDLYIVFHALKIRIVKIASEFIFDLHLEVGWEIFKLFIYHENSAGLVGREGGIGEANWGRIGCGNIKGWCKPSLWFVFFWLAK